MFHITSTSHVSTPPHSTTHHLKHLAYNTTSTNAYFAPCHSPHSSSFHIAQRSTFHATAHTLPRFTSHNVPHSMPQPTLYLVSHRATFHIPCHSTHTNPYYTTTFHNPILVWETRDYMWSVLLCSFRHSHITFYTTYPTQKWWWKSATCFKLSGGVFNGNIAYKLSWSEPAVLGENDCCFSSSSFLFSHCRCVGPTCFT